jgi:hypothetical protein
VEARQFRLFFLCGSTADSNSKGVRVKSLISKKKRLIFITILFAAGAAVADEKNDSNFSPATLYLRGIEIDAEVIINDHLVKQPVSGPILTPPGYLHIMVGVKDTVFHKSFFIHPNEHKIFNLKTNPAYGAIDLISEPGGASVSFDGKGAGVTPFLDSLIMPGLISVTIDKYGYDTIRKEIQLLPQEVLEMTCEMKHTSSWLDSVSKAKALHRRKMLFVQRIVYGAIGFAGGSIAMYFDRTAQNNITVADASADAYDKVSSGFQGYKDTYNRSRESAQKNMDKRNVSTAVAAAATVGFAITFFF